MIDLHHHLLPGVDDGSKDLANSVAMVEMAVQDGITHIVATPHANHAYAFDRERNQALLQSVQEALPAGIADKIHLGLGCDFHLSVENVEDAHRHPKRYTINGTEYLLIELADFSIPNQLGEVLYAMRVDGLMPILTHPERNPTLQRSPDLLESWIESGLLLQVTAGSLTGTFGPKAQTMAWKLLRAGQVQFLATDAHDLKRRPPQMSEARALLEKKLGREVGQRLCVDNPLAVFEGRALPLLDEQIVSDEAEGADRPFWRRIFG